MATLCLRLDRLIEEPGIGKGIEASAGILAEFRKSVLEPQNAKRMLPVPLSPISSACDSFVAFRAP